MGKDLKGKELGKGICQRKDGLYSARCTQHGQSYGRYFKTVKEAKQWLKEFSANPTILFIFCAKFTSSIMRKITIKNLLFMLKGGHHYVNNIS